MPYGFYGHLRIFGENSVSNKKRSDQLNIANDASSDEKEKIYAGLQQYNADQTQGMIREPGIDIFLTLKNDQGDVLGGISCIAVLKSLNIQVLWIDERYRGIGYGKDLVLEAERIAKQNGCISAQTTSYSFQALDFYQKLGYEVFGVFDIYPNGIKKYFLMKRF